MILVTGAGGKTGRAIIRRLAAEGQPARAWVRRPDVVVEGAAEMFVGDLSDPDDWTTAVKAIDAVYLICPNMHPEEEKIGRLGIEAIKESQADRIVYHSVLHPQTEEMPHHWAKLRVEEQILASGIPFVILQPTAYMQNLRPQLLAIEEKGVLRLPYPPESEISLVDLADVATVAAQALTDNRLEGGIFELCGTPPLSQHDVAVAFEQALNRPVVAQEIQLDAWEAGAVNLPAYARETLKRMFRYYARHGLVGNPTILSHLLGRRPTPLSDVITSW